MRRAMCLGYSCVCLLGAAAQAAVLEEFTVEDWSGLALSDDETGRLASCAIFAKYQNGATLFFVKNVDGGWIVSLVHDSWTLTESSEYPIQFKVDRQQYLENAGVALDVDQIGVAVPDDDPLLRQVRRGKLLNILFQSKEYGFELSNSGKALQAAARCIERGRDTGGQQVAQAGISGREAPPQGVLQQGFGAAPDLPADIGETVPVSELRTFGRWVVTTTDLGAGASVTCTAFGVYGDDQLILSYRPDTWDFGLHRGAWRLDTNQTYYLHYNVDEPVEGAGVIKRPVEAVEPTRILFEVSGEEDLVARMEGGRRINLQLRGVALEPQTFSYPLDQAAEAFAATRDCARRIAEDGRTADAEGVKAITGQIGGAPMAGGELHSPIAPAGSGPSSPTS